MTCCRAEAEKLPFYLEQIRLQVARNLYGKVALPVGGDEGIAKPARHQIDVFASLCIEMVRDDQNLRFEIFGQVAQFLVKLAFGEFCELRKIRDVDDIPLKILVLRLDHRDYVEHELLLTRREFVPRFGELVRLPDNRVIPGLLLPRDNLPIHGLMHIGNPDRKQF